MAFDYKGLQELQAQEQKLASKKAAYRAEALGTINKLINAFGFKAEDLDFTGETLAKAKTRTRGPKKEKAPAKTKRVVKPKYQAPDGTTWSGRGKMPVKMRAFVEAGTSLESMAIKEVEAAPVAAEPVVQPVVG